MTLLFNSLVVLKNVLFLPDVSHNSQVWSEHMKFDYITKNRNGKLVPHGATDPLMRGTVFNQIKASETPLVYLNEVLFYIQLNISKINNEAKSFIELN